VILQALKEYYDRKPDLAPAGWIRQRIDYVIVLDETGGFQNVISMQETKGGKTEGFPCLVPNIGKQALKHTNTGMDANLLWDNANFVLGIGNKGKKKIESFIRR
jgi:CRISPR-associated protein Csd1